MNHWTHIYFIGIGGIGMSALARWFRHEGKTVAGYDRVSSPLTQALENEGIAIHYEDLGEHIAPDFQDPERTLVVITPAVPSDHGERQWFESQGFTIKKRAEVLGIISQDYVTIAVAGTHGKTSTCALIAYMLHACNKHLVAFLGGIAVNFNSNLILNKAAGRQIAVIEADEYDRSFLQLHPNIAVITAVEADHLDIYGSEDNMVDAFQAFSQQLNPDGYLLVYELVTSIHTKYLTYGLGKSNFSIKINKIQNGISYFTFFDQEKEIVSGETSLIGKYNLDNLCAALSAIYLTDQSIFVQAVEALKNYKGVKRRLETRFRSKRIIYIDDYAHHPTEITSLIHAIREAFPTKEIHLLFQPHLFSRTRDFAPGFAHALDQADSIALLPIYPARELPITGVDSQLIAKYMQKQPALIKKSEVNTYISGIEEGLLLTVGAGDIDQLVDPIVSHLKHRK